MWSDFILKWSEVSYGEVLGDKSVIYIRVTLYWGYLFILWLFHLVISGTVFVLTCFLMCGCFGNMCTCIYCVLYILYCVFVLFPHCIIPVVLSTISTGAVRSSNTTRLIIYVFILIITTCFGYYCSPSSGCLYVLLDSHICDVIWVGLYRRALARVWVCWGVRWP
jgi:hypothetical protein